MGFRGQPGRGLHEQKGEGLVFSCRKQPLPLAVCVCAMKGSVHLELLYLGSTKEPRGANLDLLDWGEGCPGCPYSSLSSGGHVKSFIRK